MRSLSEAVDRAVEIYREEVGVAEAARLHAQEVEGQQEFLREEVASVAIVLALLSVFLGRYETEVEIDAGLPSADEFEDALRGFGKEKANERGA